MILSVILSQVDLGTTFLLTSSFLRLQGRHSMIFWAVASPIPDKVCCWSLLAVLMSIRPLCGFLLPRSTGCFCRPAARGRRLSERQAAQNGRFTVLQQTTRQKWQAKLRALKEELRRRMRPPNREQGAYLRSMLGHFRHYGVPMNGPALCAFRKAVGCRGGRYCDVAARVTSCRGAPLRDGFRRLVCVILIPRGSRPDLCAARGETPRADPVS